MLATRQKKSLLRVLINFSPVILVCVLFVFTLTAYFRSSLPTYSGVIHTTHFDNFNDSVSGEIYTLHTEDGADFTLKGSSDLGSYLKDGGYYRLKASRIDQTLLLNTSDSSAIDQIHPSNIFRKDETSAAVSYRSLGEQRVATVFVTWPGATPTQVLLQDARDWISKTNDYYRINSRGKASVSGEAFGPYQITAQSSCDSAKIIDEAIRVSDADINFRNYDHIVVVGPFVSLCNAYGLATTNAIRHTADGDVSLYGELVDSVGGGFIVFGHEVSHNIGLSHSQFLNCGSISLSPVLEGGYPKDCARVEYGDPFDIMSAGLVQLGHLNAIHMHTLGWFEAGEFVHVTQDATYTLLPLSSDTVGVKALQIDRGNESCCFRHLVVEYRQAIGADSNLVSCAINGILNGASIRVGNVDADESWLLVADPPGEACNSTLGVGRTFTDPATGTQITVVSKTSQGLTVSVHLGTNPTLSPQPTVSASPSTIGCSETILPFTVFSPQGYSFAGKCFGVGKQIYSDDPRFTFFNSRDQFANMYFVQTGNIREKADQALAWSLNVNHPSRVFVFYRKIPGQIAPAWIRQNYTKVTPDSFSDVAQFLLRKNDLGLIGVYDIYTKDVTVPGSVAFFPASDQSVTAYSMYIVGVKKL